MFKLASVFSSVLAIGLIFAGAGEAQALTEIQARAQCWKEIGIPNPLKARGADKYVPQINTCVGAKMKGAAASPLKK
jgi:hypothetical protein